MSYILSALRKAEQESKRRSKPEEDVWDDTDWSAPRPSAGANLGLKVAVASSVILLLVVLVLIWMMLENISKPLDEEVNVASLNNIAPLSGGNTQNDGADVEQASSSSELDSAPAEAASYTSQPEPADESVISGEKKTLNEQVELPVVTGHLYFPANESLSRLFGETGSYRVGHVFDNGLTLISISETLAVFEKGNAQYEMSLSN